jgi:hypothetical protein
LPVTAREQNAGHFFRIVVVHLAAESFQEKGAVVG